jgi:hypothetical protein
VYVPAKKVVIHHTATSNTYTDGAAEVRAIYAYHTGTLGWGDIGYNALVDKYGYIYEGRHGRGEDSDPREILSADVVAGHALAYIHGSLGISAIGNYQKAQPSAALLTAIGDLTTFECARHFIDPAGVSAFLRSDDVWHDGVNNIAPHDEVNSTQCPGRNLKSYLPALRDHVRGRQGWNPAPALDASAPRELVEGASVTFTKASDAVLHSLEGWYKAPGEEPIRTISGYAPSGYVDPAYPLLGAPAQAWCPPAQAWCPEAEWPQDGVITFWEPGHYTMHVRSDGYEANLTFLVREGGSTTSEIHVGDLDAVATNLGTEWTATVTVTIHDATEGAVTGATVSGTWSGGYSGSGTCSTDANGVCSITTGSMTRRSTSVTFTVTDVVKDPAVYRSDLNDVTSITIDRL